jgi:hypothetical protein
MCPALFLPLSSGPLAFRRVVSLLPRATNNARAYTLHNGRQIKARQTYKRINFTTSLLLASIWGQRFVFFRVHRQYG